MLVRYLILVPLGLGRIIASMLTASLSLSCEGMLENQQRLSGLERVGRDLIRQTDPSSGSRMGFSLVSTGGLLALGLARHPDQGRNQLVGTGQAGFRTGLQVCGAEGAMIDQPVLGQSV